MIDMKVFNTRTETLTLNHTKTELILFTKKKTLKHESIQLNAGSSVFKSVKSIRAQEVHEQIKKLIPSPEECLPGPG